MIFQEACNNAENKIRSKMEIDILIYYKNFYIFKNIFSIKFYENIVNMQYVCTNNYLT